MPQKGREMRSSDETPWWLRDDLEIIGFEDEEDDDDEEEDDDSEEEDEEDSDDEEEEDEDDEEDEEEDEDKPKGKKKKAAKPNIDGLKSALRSERIQRKNLERQLKKLKAAPVKKAAPKKGADDDDKEPKPDPQAEAERQLREERLSKRLRDNAIDTLILQNAQNFRNPKEALALVSRREIEVDQDEDDPSEIEIDEESVVDAIKALAKRSPHLLKSKDERRPKSGSKFNGKKKGSKEPSDDELREKYAALRR